MRLANYTALLLAMFVFIYASTPPLFIIFHFSQIALRCKKCSTKKLLSASIKRLRKILTYNKTKYDHRTIHSTTLGMQASIPEEHRKSYEKLEGKAIYNHPQPHDTHRITRSIYYRRATRYLFMAFAHYNDWPRGSPTETSRFD